MTPTEFRAALSRLGLSQAGFARLSGMDGRQVRRWAAGHAPIPSWAPVMLDLLEHVPGALDRLVGSAAFLGAAKT